MSNLSVSGVDVGKSTDVSGVPQCATDFSGDAGRESEVRLSTLRTKCWGWTVLSQKAMGSARCSPRSQNSGKSTRQVPLAICALHFGSGSAV